METATTPSPTLSPTSRALRRREVRLAERVAENSRTILPSAVLCMRITKGYPYKISYRHRWQGHGTQACRRCGKSKE